MTLGKRIRRIRAQRELTLEKLAQSTGLTVSFLSQVERNATSPSVESLQKIARALGTKVGAFFEGEERKELTLIRKAQRPRRIDEKTHLTVETLASGLLNISMEPRLVTLEVGGRLAKSSVHARQRSSGWCLRGRLRLCEARRSDWSWSRAIVCI